MKKLDKYIISTFFGPFLFIFSVLMFIFIVQFAFTQIDEFMGKGLSIWDIVKILYYLGLDVIKIVLPLTILLASIMAFGNLGERYELAAMKASGISVVRIMLPLFCIVGLMSIGLMYFSNTILPNNQKRAKNLMFEIIKTRPSINFQEGKFNTDIQGFSVKIDRKRGENGELWEGVFIHKNASAYDDQQNITAKRGKILLEDKSNYLILELYDGALFFDNVFGLTKKDVERQKNQTVKFDTLTQKYDVSEILESSLDSENESGKFKTLNYSKLNYTIDTTKTSYSSNIQYLNKQGETLLLGNLLPSTDKNHEAPFDFNKLSGERKQDIIKGAISGIETQEKYWNLGKSENNGNIRYLSRVILWQQRILAYSISCIVFFLIGAPLGSIIRKGGIGVPVIIALVIFILFYIVSMYTENLAKDGNMNSYLASWLPNMLLVPLGGYLTWKALRDSDMFSIDRYLAPFRKIINKFIKPKEHARYQ